jgi:oligopeptidase B
VTELPNPPRAKRVASERTLHGDTVVDEYAWLRDREDPDTLAYLEGENAYCEAVTAHMAPLRASLFDEIKARVQETDMSVPARLGDWWYYTRTLEGSQYAIQCRRPDRRGEYDEGAPEVVLLDENVLAAGAAYFNLGAYAVSPDGTLLAYSVDTSGDEAYTMRFRDLERGQDLPDEIPNTSYGAAWSADGRFLFYVTLDEAKRPYRLWRHRLGTASTDDRLIREEPDERFFLGIHTSRSRRYLFLSLHSMVTSEIWMLPADAPEADFRVIEPRRQGIEYDATDQGDRLLIVSNDGHEDFALFSAPAGAPERANWEPLWAPGPGTRVLGVDAFAGHYVISYRARALTGLRVVRTADGEAHDIAFPEPVYSVGPGTNLGYDTTMYRLGYTSMTVPSTVYDYGLDDRRLTLRKRQPVLGGFDPERYESAREWATAPDGTRVPISLVWRRGVARDGGAPCLLYGYGSYEASMDPGFSSSRLSLLDRGFVYAIAHVRGGGELGRRWYEDGKLLHKRNTFTDFIACADHLIEAGWTSARGLVARGGSAGGLLMGAVANLGPDRFRAIVAEQPFVDALNTIIDPSLPLTVIEWEEWGNPIESGDVYRYMKGYSPYENVTDQEYPALLVTTGLNDPRVGYHEPAKWVARLREEGSLRRPLVLKTEMGSGHFGPSGRYEGWRQEAFVLAFVIDAAGARTAPD